MRVIQICIISLALAIAARGTIICVPRDYLLIQDAVNATTVGDTVWVSPGTYYERVIMPGRDFLLVSDYFFTSDTTAINSTIINARNYEHQDTASVLVFLGPNSRETLVCGFTLTGGHGFNHRLDEYIPFGGAMCIEDASPTIRRNILKGNRAVYFCGIYARNSSLLLTECRLDSNCGGSEVVGVLYNIDHELPAEIEWCEFTRNFGCWEGGALLWGGGVSGHLADLRVRNNHFHDYGAYDFLAVDFIDSRGEFTGNVCERLYTEQGMTSIVVFSDDYDHRYADNVFRDCDLGSPGMCIVITHRAYSQFVHVIARNWFENITNAAPEGGPAAMLLSSPMAIIEDNVALNCTGASGVIGFSSTSSHGCAVTMQRNQFLYNRTGYVNNHLSVIYSSGQGAHCLLRNNWFEGNDAEAIRSAPPSRGIWDVSNNYWGHVSGPYHPIENPTGQGDTVDVNTTVTPWLTEPPDLDESVRERFHLSPEDWSVEYAFPNPFNASTHIRIISAKSQPFEVAAYNILGQRVARVWQGVIAKDAPTLIRWDAEDELHRKVASGIYYLVALPKGPGAVSPKSTKVVLLR